MITPSVGRIVHVYTRRNLQDGYAVEGPHAAIVVSVWGPCCINVLSFNGAGAASFHSSLTLRQPEDAQPTASTSWAEWMPFQVEQVAKVTNGDAAGAGSVRTCGVIDTNPRTGR